MTDASLLTVLVVDDEESARLRLVAALKRIECQILQADSAQSAAQIAMTWEIDALVTDIVMPGGGGIGLIRWLRHLHPEVVVIAVSGKGAEGLEAAKRLGASCVLAKPVEPDALVRAVRTAERSRRRRRA